MTPIGIFDSGYGGLTILDSIRRKMPQYDYIYFGDNARAPYGTRSFDVVYEFTLEAVKQLFAMDCPLIILGCNTASAKALRNIQQNYLPHSYPDRRVLGVIRPTAEIVGQHTKTRHIGVLATEGTIRSESYNETRNGAAGNYIAETNTAAQNLKKLDDAIKNIEKGNVETIAGNKTSSSEKAAKATGANSVAIGYNTRFNGYCN